jgi:RIO-like serine/threonine protein kinase
MSYCRFSCDDFQSDVYAYETEGGYQIHVAKKKRVFIEPLPEKVPFPTNQDEEKIQAWFDRHRVVMDIIDRSECVDIGLPYDGESFCEDSLEDLLERLKSLREIGYRVPDFAIMVVENEIWEKG